MIGVTSETRAKKRLIFNILPMLYAICMVRISDYCERGNTLLYSTRKMSIAPELPWLLPLFWCKRFTQNS